MKDENRRNPLLGDLSPPSLWGKVIPHERAIVVNSRHTSRQVHYTPFGTIWSVRPHCSVANKCGDTR